MKSSCSETFFPMGSFRIYTIPWFRKISCSSSRMLSISMGTFTRSVKFQPDKVRGLQQAGQAQLDSLEPQQLVQLAIGIKKNLSPYQTRDLQNASAVNQSLFPTQAKMFSEAVQQHLHDLFICRRKQILDRVLVSYLVIYLFEIDFFFLNDHHCGVVVHVSV